MKMKDEGYSYSSFNVMVSSITLFFIMNDVNIGCVHLRKYT